MKFAKLIDETGHPIDNPEAVEGSISWRPNGMAYAWGADGKTRIAEMHGAQVIWIEGGGIRIEGMEPIDAISNRYRAQSWQLSF